MNPIDKERMAESRREEGVLDRARSAVVFARIGAMVLSLIFGGTTWLVDSYRREALADCNAMQRGLVGEADTVVGMRSDHDAVRRAVTWSSYPAQIVLKWCRECMAAQDEDGRSWPECARCDINHDGTLSGEDIEQLTQYIRQRFDGFKAAVDRKGATVEQLLTMGEQVTESWWDELETRLGE